MKFKNYMQETEVDLSTGGGVQLAPEVSQVAPVENPPDMINVDVALFIRLMEYAHENAKTDQELHEIATRAAQLCSLGRTLSMDDYQTLVTELRTPADDPN